MSNDVIQQKVRRCMDESLSKNYEILLDKMAKEWGRPLTDHEKRIVRRAFFVGSTCFEVTLKHINLKLKTLT